MRCKEREIKSIMGPIGELSVTSSSSESQSEDDYQPSASTPVAAAAPSPHMTPKNIFKSREVVGALDRVNLPDRGAVFVAAAVAQALGHNVPDITLSRSSIRRSRRQVRQEAATAEAQEYSLDGPLLLHWDGKLLPDINGSKVTNR